MPESDMNWYDRAPLYVIALLTSAIWGTAMYCAGWLLGPEPSSLTTTGLLAVLGAVFAVRERIARRRAGLAK